jgi:hypothetical protein
VIAGKKPTVFISSTIFDLEDLRAALKFWLEESGFEVWLSEYNDMDKNPSANAFEACFQSIRTADFYVLLVGDRKGSLFDEKEGVSVTQQEYRVAYQEFASQERPVPILFVRSRVKHLLDAWASTEPDGSPPFEDASFIRQFLAEVTKEQETTEAVKGIGRYPPANWLHRFHDFRDIVSALTVALSLRANVPLQRVLTGIRLELEITLSRLLDKLHEGDAATPVGRHSDLRSVTKHITLDPVDRSPIHLNRQQTAALSVYLGLGLPQPDELWLEPLRQAVHSADLLGYDPLSRRLDETALSLAATDLLREAHAYQRIYAVARPLIDNLLERLVPANTLKHRQFELSWKDALVIWGLHYVHVNLYRRVASLYAYLTGHKETPTPDLLLPSTPLGPRIEREIDRERATTRDIREWSEIPGFWNL